MASACSVDRQRVRSSGRRVASTTLGVSSGVAAFVLGLTTIAVWGVPFFIGTTDTAEIATARWVVALLGIGLAVLGLRPRSASRHLRTS